MIRLFHGSCVEVRSPRVDAGRKKVDFGQKIVDECVRFVGSTEL